jgi:ribosomal protein L11 methyltransferase
MAVIELKAEIPSAAAAAVEGLLAEREELRLMLIEEKATGRVWLTGYYESEAEARRAWQELLETTDPTWNTTVPVVRALPDEDWKDSYKAHFQAWKFGRLNWVPVWERESFQPGAGEAVLWLDPGMAFGTGNHETTRLCCERLVAFAETRGDSARVIDAGCGSGILALSAAKLGFKEVTGFDNDPEAVRVSQENATLNELAGRVAFEVGDLMSGLRERSADLVMANIQADVLIRFAQELSAAVAPGGRLVLSGILARELASVQDRFSRLNPDWQVDSRLLGEWADLLLIRPA